MRSRISGIDAVVFIHQGLVPMLLGPQGSGDALRTVHHAATLVIQAQNRGHTIPAGCPFQRGGDRFGKAGASGFGSGPRRKSSNKGLLFHSRLCLERTGKIMQVPHLISTDLRQRPRDHR